MKSILFFLSFLLASLSHTVLAEPPNVTGSYRNKESHLNILQSAPDQIQFDLIAFWRQGPGEGQVNSGVACDKLKLVGSKAVYKNTTYGECEITMDFLPGKVKVVQSGGSSACGFGFNVEATGLYRRISTKPPRMDPCQKN